MSDVFYVNKGESFLEGLVTEIEKRKAEEEREAMVLLPKQCEHNCGISSIKMPILIGFKRLNDDAILPTKEQPTDSGFELYASENVIIEPGETAIIPTGIAVELTKGFEAQVRPRSGITAKTKLRVQLGTIDQEYTGEIGVIVDNIGVKEICDLDLNSGTVEYCEPSYPYLLNGTISDDWEDYTGTPKPTYKIRKGDRIAQLVVQALPEVVAVEIDDFTEDSERGDGGFGSTGV